MTATAGSLPTLSPQAARVSARRGHHAFAPPNLVSTRVATLERV
jgi:hypothetical protein